MLTGRSVLNTLLLCLQVASGSAPPGFAKMRYERTQKAGLASAHEIAKVSCACLVHSLCHAHAVQHGQRPLRHFGVPCEKFADT